MSRYQTIGQLFEEEPIQWGLRGDPYLWRRMCAHFSSTPLPSDVLALEQQIAEAFQNLTHRPLSTSKDFYVREFAHGGMPSGGIAPEFWRESALPILRARHAET